MPLVALTLLSSITASQLLDCSIRYHDPHGNWMRGAFEIVELAKGPDDIERRNVLRFDNAQGRFEWKTSVDGRSLTATVQHDSVVARIDGRADLPADELARYRLKPDQILSRRNRDQYLWGLPMKLRDPGTRLDPRVKETHFEGKVVYPLRVTYEPRVGKDTWYFFFSPDTCSLEGHRFHHDEAKGDGEYAVLSEEATGQGLRLPRVRRWYTNNGGEPVITHTIVSITKPSGP